MFNWANGGKGLTPATPSPQSGTREWGMNPAYDWGEDTTNQQILADIGANNDAFLQKHGDYLNQAPRFNLENRGAVNEWINNNPYTNDKGWSKALNALGNDIYQQGTVGYKPGTPYVPAGYASPISGGS